MRSGWKENRDRKYKITVTDNFVNTDKSYEY